jgi:hypothetical protein
VSYSTFRGKDTNTLYQEVIRLRQENEELKALALQVCAYLATPQNQEQRQALLTKLAQLL